MFDPQLMSGQLILDTAAGSAFRPRTRQLVGVTLSLLCAAAPAWAQGKVDVKLMQRYGGALAPECGNYLLPQLLINETLVVREGGKAIVTGRNVKEVRSYFGATPPPEFETALTSEVGK